MLARSRHRAAADESSGEHQARFDQKSVYQLLEEAMLVQRQFADRSSEEGPWYEVLRRHGRSAEASDRVQQGIVENELALSTAWCENARILASIEGGKSLLEEYAAVDNLDQTEFVAEQEWELDRLRLEALASIFDPTERRAAFKANRETLIEREHSQLNEFLALRRVTNRALLHHYEIKRDETAASCSRLPLLLSQSGKLIALSNRRIFNEQSCTLSRRMETFFPELIADPLPIIDEGGELLGYPSKLSSIDKSDRISIENGGLSFQHNDPPSPDPFWASVRSNKSVYIAPRFPNHRALHRLKTLCNTNTPSLEVLSRLDAESLLKKLAAVLQECIEIVHCNTISSEKIDDLLGDIHFQNPTKQGSPFDGKSSINSDHRSPQTEVSPSSDSIVSEGTPRSQKGRYQEQPVEAEARIHSDSPQPKESFEQQNQFRLLMKNLYIMGYATRDEAATFLTNSDPSTLLRVTNSWIQSMKIRLESWGRFFFEFHAANADHEWTVGIARAEAFLQNQIYEHVPFPGGDEHSFGFSSDGKVWNCNKATQYTTPFNATQIIGILLDMYAGSVSAFKDGKWCQVAFGRDAIKGNDEDREEMAAILSKGHWIPAFSLRGLVGSSNGGAQAKFRVPPRDLNGVNSQLTAGPEQIRSGKYARSKTRAVVRPFLSVNFGTLPFVYPAPGCIPVDFHSSLSSEEELLSIRNDGHFYLPALDLPITNLFDNGVGKTEELPIQRESMQWRQGFLEALDPEETHSFSNFPPSRIKTVQAIISIQQGTRRFLQRLHKKRAELDLERSRGKKAGAQAHYALNHILTIQRAVRSYRARKHANELRKQRRINSQKIALPSAVMSKVAAIQIKAKATRDISVLTLQRVWRGRSIRRQLLRSDPIRAIRLNQLGQAIKLNLADLKATRVYGHLLRAWLTRTRVRIHRDMIYTAVDQVMKSVRSFQLRSRLDSQYDAVQSVPLKTFLGIIGVIDIDLDSK